MTTLAEHIIVAGAENRPLMLDKSMYDSWVSRIILFIKGKKHGRMILDSIYNGPLVYLTVEEDGQVRPKKYSELTEAQKLQDECDVQATNIILHGLPPDLINDMHTIRMKMQQVKVNTKFLNALLPEWSQFVTDVKLAKSLYTTNYDMLYAYLSQHVRHANEIIPQNATFQTEDLDAYDSDCNDISSAKAVLMENLSSCDSDVLSEVSYSDTYPNDMINQDVQEMTYSKQTHLEYFPDNEINNDTNIILYSQYLQETQDAGILDTNSSAPNDLLVLSLVE
nr:hypothetical protein [Tanacetum cinerariifolium]